MDLPSTDCKWLHYDEKYPRMLWLGTDYIGDSVVLRVHAPGDCLTVTYTPRDDPRRVSVPIPLADLVEWLRRNGAI